MTFTFIDINEKSFNKVVVELWWAPHSHGGPNSFLNSSFVKAGESEEKNATITCPQKITSLIFCYWKLLDFSGFFYGIFFISSLLFFFRLLVRHILAVPSSLLPLEWSCFPGRGDRDLVAEEMEVVLKASALRRAAMAGSFWRR